MFSQKHYMHLAGTPLSWVMRSLSWPLQEGKSASKEKFLTPPNHPILTSLKCRPFHHLSCLGWARLNELGLVGQHMSLGDASDRSIFFCLKLSMCNHFLYVSIECFVNVERTFRSHWIEWVGLGKLGHLFRLFLDLFGIRLTVKTTFNCYQYRTLYLLCS